jgi:hypothetical protein
MAKYEIRNSLTVVLTRNLLARTEENHEKYRISHGTIVFRIEHLTHTSLTSGALTLHQSAQFNGLYVRLYFWYEFFFSLFSMDILKKLAELVREEYTWKPETVNEISDGN